MSREGLTILGLDAANPVLLQRWMADGSLPHLAALKARGMAGPVDSVAGFFVGASWPSFQTGLSPAGHGFHYLAQIRPGSYDYFEPFGAPEGVLGEPFWRALGREGRRVAVLDVPLSRIESALNGVQTVEWGGHDSIFGFQACPPELVGEILAQFGPHPVGPVCDGQRVTVEDWGRFRDALVDGADRKAKLTRMFLDRGPWDLLIQVFTETHCAGHQMWHLHDPSHPAHDPTIASLLGDPLKQAYQAVDAAVGAVLERTGDTTVLVVSLHGMRGYYGAGFLLPELLSRFGFSVPEAVPAQPWTARRALTASARWGWHKLPLTIRDRLRPLRRRLLPNPPSGPRRIGVDLAKSRCFVVGNGAPVSGIRLNLAGREPTGCLAQGPEADDFVAELTDALLGVNDERTGRRAIRAITRTSSLHPGPELHRLPDLLVEWEDEAHTGSMQLAGGRGATVRLTAPSIGTVSGVNWYGRSGDHRPGGMYVLAGPGIPAGQEGRAVEVTEFAPAILRACRGEPIPWPFARG